MKKQVEFWLGASVAFCLFTTAPLNGAQEDNHLGGNSSVMTPLPPSITYGEICVGGDLLFRLRVPAGGISLQKRASKVNERLTAVLGDPPIKPEEVVVKKARPDYAMFVRNRMIVTIDKRLAKANRTTPYKLGQRWLKSLRVQMPQY